MWWGCWLVKLNPVTICLDLVLKSPSLLARPRGEATAWALGTGCVFMLHGFIAHVMSFGLG